MMQISYVTIETLSPVVVTAPGSSQLLTASSESFSGTLLRGVLAGKYVSDHKLGTKAHEDENFIRYFSRTFASSVPIPRPTESGPWCCPYRS